MFAKQFAAGLVATTLLSTAAFAQAPAPAAKDPPTGQSSSMPRADTSAQPVQTQSSSEWRTSKVVGLYVYNDANERLGSINDLLTNSSGKIAKAVIGVGGFLGIGESDVAVNFDQLKFVNEPMRTTTSSTTPAPRRRQVRRIVRRLRSARPRPRPQRRRRSRASIQIMPSSA